jgi:membrane protein
MAIAERGAGRGRADQDGQGVTDSPIDIPPRAWVDVLKRTKEQVKSDSMSLLAAGVAFYGVLALFPALVAVLSIYGLLSDPADVTRQVEGLSANMPNEVRELITEQLQSVASTGRSSLSVGLVVSILAAMWAASKGMKALIDALNVAYDEDEDRGFIKIRLLAYGFTVGAVLLVIMAVATITIVPALADDLGPVGVTATIIRWPLLALVMMIGLAIIYRYAPSRKDPQWRWVSPGSVVATTLWLGGSALFALYVNNFGSYNETYGSIGAVVVLMLWLFLTAFVVLLGAELNGETEDHVEGDTTTD